MQGKRDPVLVVAICTYRRPNGLRRVLEALAVQEHGGVACVLVLDNDPGCSAEPVVRELEHRLTMEYRPVSPQGLATARNAGLDYARSVDLPILFIDDDEWPLQGWLTAMREASAELPEDVLAGPIFPSFEGKLPSWSRDGRHWRRAIYDDGAIVSASVPDANMLFPLSVVRSAFRYDVRFDTSGGQDTELLARLRRGGYNVRWVAAACVAEWIPSGRLTSRYLETRSYFDAISYFHIARAGGESLVLTWLRTVKNVGVSMFYAFLALLARSPAYAVESRLARSRARGTVAGLRGRSYNRWVEYQQDTAEGGHQRID